MAFSDTFLTQLATDLETALSLPTAAIYRGRRPQRVARSEKEVWLEPLDVGNENNGLGGVREHRVRVHVRLAEGADEGNRTGAAKQTSVRTDLETVEARYNGVRRFYSALTDLVCLSAEIDRPDDNPDEAKMDGSVLVRALERV